MNCRASASRLPRSKRYLGTPMSQVVGFGASMLVNRAEDPALRRLLKEVTARI
jgi:hypothetical protein